MMDAVLFGGDQTGSSWAVSVERPVHDSQPLLHKDPEMIHQKEGRERREG